MRAGASLSWRIATAVAFGATAALAVIVSRGAHVDAALASAKGPGAQHAAAGTQQAVAARCALSGLRISLGPGARVTTVITRYPLEFTNVSGAPCTLAGYPEVAAYRGDGVQVGAAAGHDLSVAAHRVLLAPGQTAHATLDASVPAARCGPVRASRAARRRYARAAGRPLRQAPADGLHRPRCPRTGLPARTRDPVRRGRQCGHQYRRPRGGQALTGCHRLRRARVPGQADPAAYGRTRLTTPAPKLLRLPP